MMKEEDKMLGAMPCNDRAIFLEEDGFIHERIGIVWKADRAAGCESPYFVDRDGFIYEPVPVSEGENSLIIANIGDTVRPEALKTVIPIKKKTKEIRKRTIHLIADDSEARDKLALYEAKHQTARARLLRELITEREIDYSVVTAKLNVSSTVIKALCDQNIVTVTDEKSYRNPVKHLERRGYDIVLNENQQMLVDEITGSK